MSTSQFRIREFEAANERLATAKSKLTREQKELKDLEKRLEIQRARVKADQKKVKEAELNLKEVEGRWKVIDIDGSTTTDATDNINDFTSSDDSDDASDDSDDGYRYVDDDDEVTKEFKFKFLVVQGCGVLGANGGYAPYAITSDGKQIYLKIGNYCGYFTEFGLVHCDHGQGSGWRLRVLKNSIGDMETLYTSRSKTSIPKKDDWRTGSSGVDPVPSLTGYKMS